MIAEHGFFMFFDKRLQNARILYRSHSAQFELKSEYAENLPLISSTAGWFWDFAGHFTQFVSRANFSGIYLSKLTTAD